MIVDFVFVFFMDAPCFPSTLSMGSGDKWRLVLILRLDGNDTRGREEDGEAAERPANK